MKFTDEDGREYESITTGDFSAIIRPVVKAEPKWLIDVGDCIKEEFDYDVCTHFTGTKDQAQLIKEAVEALMESIMGRNVKDDPFEDYELRDRINKARAALKDEL